MSSPQRQELVVPLGVTMNEGVPRELLPVGQVKDIQNGRVRKPGKLEKRNGFSLLAGGLGNDTEGSTITSPGQRLLRRDSELLLVDGNNELHSYSSTRDQWKPRALVPEVQVKGRRCIGQNYYRGLVTHPVTARIGNYLAVAWTDTIGADQVICRVYDEVTGTLLIELRDVANRRNPRLIAVGNYFVLVVIDGTAAPFGLRGFFLNIGAATLAWSAATSLTTAASTDVDTEFSWDIYTRDSTNFILANVADTGGTLNLFRFSVDPFTLQDTESSIRAGKTITVGPTLYVDQANSTVYVAYWNDTDNQVECKGHSNSTLSQTFAAQTLASGLTADPGQVTVGPRDSTSVWVAWDINETGTTANQPGFGWRKIDFGGSVHATTHDQRSLRIASRPFYYGARSYMLAMTGYGHPTGGSMQHDQSAFLLLDLGNDQVLVSGYTGRPIARFAEGETGSVDLTQQIMSVGADGIAYFIFSVRDPNSVWTLGSGVTGTSADVVKLQFPISTEVDSHWSGWQEFGTNTFIPAGLAHHYDGDLVREFWCYYPWIDQISVLTATGSLTVGLLHEYCVVWVAMDNQGRVWRSRPSIIRSATPSGTDRAIRLRISYYSATSQETTVAFDLVGIEIYRRTASSDPFVRLFQSGIGPAVGNNKQSVTFLQVDDTGASHSTANQPNLYTTGGVLEAFTPPPCTQSVIFDNRMWVFNRNMLWYSREFVDGEGPAFHPAQTIVVGDEADVTAMAVMDSNLIIFKAESIFFMQGQGPDDTGANAAYSVPQRVLSPVGAIDSRSVATGREGVYFSSRRGLERLKRDLTVDYIGERVEDAFAAHDTVTSTVHVQRDNELRFSLGFTGSQTTSTLVYDENSDVWSRDLYHSSSSPTKPLSAVCTGGDYYWLEQSSKRVYKETVGGYIDPQYSGGIQELWVSLKVETGDIVINNPVAEIEWWRTMLFARRGDSHDLTIEYAVNNADAFTSKTWTAAEIATWMQIPIEIPEILPAQQRARTIRFRISDTTSGTPRQGPILYSISLEYGAEGGNARVPAGQRK